MSASYSETMPSRIDVAAVRDWLGSDHHGPRVLDVRTTAEFSTSHIPGAYNVPLNLLREHRDELRSHLAQAVVLVCRSGARAGQAELLLVDAGLPHVHVLDGGMRAWENAGAPVNRGPQRWDLERQVRLVAGSLVLAGVLSSVLVPKMKWLSAAVGGGLGMAAITDSCIMGALLSKMPYNRDASCDLQIILAELTNSEPGGPTLI